MCSRELPTESSWILAKGFGDGGGGTGGDETWGDEPGGRIEGDCDCCHSLERHTQFAEHGAGGGGGDGGEGTGGGAGLCGGEAGDFLSAGRIYGGEIYPLQTELGEGGVA